MNEELRDERRKMYDAARLEHAEAEFIRATRKLDRLRVRLGLEHLSAKDLAAGLDHGDEQGKEGETKAESDSESATHGDPPVGVDPEPTPE
jgi:uncharacterized membrane protein